MNSLVGSQSVLVFESFWAILALIRTLVCVGNLMNYNSISSREKSILATIAFVLGFEFLVFLWFWVSLPKCVGKFFIACQTAANNSKSFIWQTIQWRFLGLSSSQIWRSGWWNLFLKQRNCDLRSSFRAFRKQVLSMRLSLILILGFPSRLSSSFLHDWPELLLTNQGHVWILSIERFLPKNLRRKVVVIEINFSTDPLTLWLFHDLLNGCSARFQKQIQHYKQSNCIQIWFRLSIAPLLMFLPYFWTWLLSWKVITRN